MSNCFSVIIILLFRIFSGNVMAGDIGIGTDLGPYLLHNLPIMNERECNPGAQDNPRVVELELWPQNVREESIRKISEAGVKYLRVTIPWAFIERQKGVYEWDQMDQILEYAKKYNLQVLGMIFTVPKWASSGKTSMSFDYEYDKGFIFAPPKDLSEWDKWVSILVDRYGCGSKGRCLVSEWEIWNEEDDPWWLRPNVDYDADGVITWKDRLYIYTQMFFRASGIIHTIEREKAYVVHGGFTGTPALNPASENKLFVESLLSYTNTMERTEGFSFHSYQKNFNLEILKNGSGYYKNLLSSKGLSSKSLWVTEVNFLSIEMCPDSDSASFFSSSDKVGDLVDDVYEYLKAEGIGRGYWFAFKDDINGPGFLKWNRATRSGSWEYNEPFVKKFSMYARGRMPAGVGSCIRCLGEGVSFESGNSNCDNRIDLYDFSMWLNEYKSKISFRGDYNCDGIVTLADFSVWLNGYKNNK